MYKMTDPARFCGGATELDTFLGQIRQNFGTHAHLFPNEKSKVSYARNLLGTWAEHPNASKRTTKGTDPATWANGLRNLDDPCLEDFDDFATEILKMYGDKDRSREAVAKAVEESRQGFHDQGETVREFASRIRELWRKAGWQEDNPVVYDLAWYGLRPHLQAKIKPFASKEPEGRFGSITELFDQAADVETPARPQQTKKQGQSEEQSKGDKPNRKRRVEPTQIEGSSKPKGKDTDRSGATKSSTNTTKPASNLPPVPFVSKEEFEGRKEKNLCLRYGKAGHRTYNCPTYSRAKLPEQSNLNASHQSKRPKVAELPAEPKNPSTSHGT